MAVDAIDVRIQSFSAQVKAQEEQSDNDRSDAAREKAENKVRQRQSDVKTQSNEAFQKASETQQKFKRIQQGAAGPDAANAANMYENNSVLNQKLNQAQKRIFHEAMANNPGKATRAAQVLDNLLNTAGVQFTSQDVAVLQQAALERPESGEELKQALVSQFMQTANADPKTRNQLLRWAAQQEGAAQQAGQQQQRSGELSRGAQQGRAASAAQAAQRALGKQQAQQAGQKSAAQRAGVLRELPGQRRTAANKQQAIKMAGAMLGNLAKNNVGPTGQRAALNMAQRTGGDGKAMENVDNFVQQPAVSKLPIGAKTQATRMLAQADGAKDVADGFVDLASELGGKNVSNENKGRFFATVGTGRSSEFRAITDQALNVLRHNNFPTRDGQVGKLLNRMQQQVKKGGAKGVKADSLIKQARSSPMPSAPKLMSMDDDMDEEARAQARSHNRAQLAQYRNALERHYDDAEVGLKKAKYADDVNRFQLLRDPEPLDLSTVDASDRQRMVEFQQRMESKLTQLRSDVKVTARRLRKKRRTPKAQEELQARRQAAAQPRYYAVDGSKAMGPGRASSAASASAGGAGGVSPMGGMGAAAGAGAGNLNVSIQQAVADAIAGAGVGQLNAQNIGRVAQQVMAQVGQQVAQQIAHALTGQGVGGAGQAQQPAAAVPVQQAQQPQQPAATGQSGMVDGWGVQRTFERDLGSKANYQAVKAPQQDQGAQGLGDYGMMPDGAAQYTGRRLVKSNAMIRSLDQMWGVEWSDLEQPEQILMKNLGWSTQLWNTRESPTARWPKSMFTPFAQLSAVQQEAVRKLGIRPGDWDDDVGRRVGHARGGKNA